ncbi:50S ribosome-binding GTPase, partial [Vibrio parahaemolyticus]
MNQTLKQFESNKQKAQALLSKLSAFLELGKEAGALIEGSLTTKIEAAMSTVDSGKLKIALVGGFSEGKTSIAAAWLGKLDTDTMSISHQESSDMVATYDIGDNCELIDTPGLFGFKEKSSASSEEAQAYKDITKKYVSEAHLLLYVMSPTNPIKASHQEELSWLFRDLNLLSRTVFILGRFDEVADVEDEWDYNENFRIKSENVIERLNDAINLSEEDKSNLSVVAVAANPFDMGMSYWLENPDKFKELSHIDTLQAATTEKVSTNGGVMAVALEAQQSVISDVLARQLPAAIRNDELIGEELSRLADMNMRLEKQLHETTTQIKEVQIGLREFVASHFSSLILQVKGSDINTFSDFFEREIGNEGAVLNTRIQNEFDRQINSLSGDLIQLKANFDNEVSHYNNAVTMMGKQGMDFVVKGGYINNSSILAARDGLVSAGKLVGLDLASLLKFKPWGAVNLAKGINGALVVVGIALEAWNSYSEHKKQKEFEDSVKSMVENFEKQREELLRLINADNFIDQFFP